MLLYLWVNNYKNIKETGFNLGSNYQFSFEIVEKEEKSNNIIGNLKCKRKTNPRIFNKNIVDIKAIVGENGSGKSTVLEILIQNIMTQRNYYFDGFIITDKYVFNRQGIDFGESIARIKYFKFEEIKNRDLVNFERKEYRKKVLEESEIKEGNNGQIATRHLNNQSIIHYSPLLNIDKINNSEGIAGSSKAWETDYWHYFDCTTENTIVDDFNSFGINDISYQISGESELLAYKSEESKRNLEFLSSEYFKNLPFSNNIEKVTVRLNDFYETFWESVDGFFKSDNETVGRIASAIASIRSKRIGNNKSELESALYISFIYGALKFEYKYRMNFGNRGESNSIISTIDLFLQASMKKKIHKTTLNSFLEKAHFTNTFKENLFTKIVKAVEFIINSPSIIKYSNDFTLSISNPEEIKTFIELFYNDFLLTDGEINVPYIFNIFTIEYVGLSSGEKNLLSMYSRFSRIAKILPESQTSIVFLLDEPEVTFHPQWQVSFLKLLNDTLPKIFSGKEIQLIISSHSPMLISDLPKNNCLFLKKNEETGQCEISDLKNNVETFGANIHTLYSDAFFLKDSGGTMGQLAKQNIQEVIKEIKSKSSTKLNWVKDVINIIGEPLIKNQLDNLYSLNYPEETLTNIDDKILFLENKLKSAKELKKNMKDESSK